MLFLPLIYVLLTTITSINAAPPFTAVDAAGNIVLASYQTNAAGATTATTVVSTISVAPQPQANQVAYNPLCTTAGCVAPPTTYAQNTYLNGVQTVVIVTFVPAVPTPVVPTIRSSGSILGISQYITTTFTSTLFTTITTGGGSRSSFIGLSDGGVCSLLVIVAGLVGALFVL